MVKVEVGRGVPGGQVVVVEWGGHVCEWMARSRVMSMKTGWHARANTHIHTHTSFNPPPAVG